MKNMKLSWIIGRHGGQIDNMQLGNKCCREMFAHAQTFEQQFFHGFVGRNGGQTGQYFGTSTFFSCYSTMLLTLAKALEA